MKRSLYLIAVFALLFSLGKIHAQQLVVYDNVPGRNASDQYVCKVKFESENDSEFRNAFALQTTCKTDAGYYDNLYGWSASWIAFESDFIGDNVVVEISKKDGSAITKAMVRPVAATTPAVISNGKAYVTLDGPMNINIDINGQMEDQYTGMDYSGNPVHTISVFANPLYEVPNTSDSGVIELNPGDAIPSDRSSWHTIYFKPGVHDIGNGFEILSNETLYIPGNAVVHGTIHPPNLWGASSAQNIKVYGSGALSGENNTWSGDMVIENKTFTYQAADAILEGFVVIDPANHTFNMGCSYDDPQHFNTYKNLKILGWRQNSDAINAFRHSVISDCFFRVQDDVFYYGENVKISNIVAWNDANGAVLFLTKGSTVMEDSYLKDVTCIYHRAKWHYWSGGRIISMRETPPGRIIQNVLIQNILIEDPFPAFPPFYGTMKAGTNDPITIDNVIIENVHQEHDGVSSNLDQTRGKPQNTLLGLDNNRQWENITFNNCYFNGTNLGSFEDGNFLTNQYVDTNTVIFQYYMTTNPPVADFSADNSTITIGNTVNFSDLSSNTPTSWNWTFQGGTPSSSTEQNPSVTYTTTGTYNVELTAANDGGSDTETKIAFITVEDVVLNDTIINVIAPDQASPGNTINVSVTYEATGNRELVVFIQQNTTPWYQYGITTVPVTAGSEIINVDLAISDTIPIATNAYKIVTNLRDVGGSWPGYDEYIKDNIDVVSYCSDDLPWSDADFTVSNNLVNYSSGLIDISCATSANISLKIEGIVKRTTGSNYCNVYYKVDGGTQQVISENSGAFALKTVSASGIVGNTLEIIINASSGHVRNDYIISNINITAEGLKSGTLASSELDIKKQESGSLKLYPNPVKNLLNIEFCDDAIKNIQVLNIAGQLLYSKQTTEQSTQLDVQSLQLRGPILIKVQSGSSVSSHKVLVQ